MEAGVPVNSSEVSEISSAAPRGTAISSAPERCSFMATPCWTPP